MSTTKQSPSQKRRAKKQQEKQVQPKRRKQRRTGWTYAATLRIGQPYDTPMAKGNHPEIIKSLGEVCSEYPGPHVHIVTNKGHDCQPLMR